MSQIDLQSPGRIGGLETANRVVTAPMTRSRAHEGGVPSALAVEYYVQRVLQIIAGVARNFVTNIHVGREFKMDGAAPRCRRAALVR